MGAIYEMNWILKLNKGQVPDLKENAEYHFKKNGLRVYPIDNPIDLVNENWEAVARCIITSITLQDGMTFGKYKVLTLYDEEEKRILTNVWRDTLCYKLNDYQITDFSNKHIT